MKNFTATSTAALAGIIVGSLGFSTSAQATTFYLGNGFDIPTVSPSFSFIEDGIGLTATGLSNANPRNVYASLFGLGVTPALFNLDNNQVDGVGTNETLVLTFDKTVNLKSVTFARVGTNDEFTLLVDGNVFISADIPGGNALDLDISQFAFHPSPTGLQFGFTVTDNNDDYLVKYVEVDVVPEPLTMLGAGTALGFGTFFKRKLAGKKSNNKA